MPTHNHPPLSRRSLLASCAAALVVPSLSAARTVTGGAPRKLVVVYAPGGWDVSYVFDPKLGVSTVEGPEVDQNPLNVDDVESVQTFSGIPIVVNAFKRPNVSRFFEAWAPKTAVVNGIQVGSISHQLGRIRMLTGVQSSLPGPDIAAVAGSVHGAGLPAGCVAMSGFASGAQLAASTVGVGARNQLDALLSDTSPLRAPLGAPNYPQNVLGPTDKDLLDAYRQGRVEAMRQTWSGSDRSAAKLADYLQSLDRVTQLRAHAPVITDALDLGVEPDLASQIALGIDLLSQNICHTVFLGYARTFDTHLGTDGQHELYDTLFAHLQLLADGLAVAGLLDDTLVVVVSEFTRCPFRNLRLGKDHWPFTSAMVFGGGTVGGQALGASDGYIQALPVDLETGLPSEAGSPLTYGSFVAGLLERIDVDPAEWVPGVTPWRGAT